MVRLFWLFNILLAFVAIGLAAALISSLTQRESSGMVKESDSVVDRPTSTAKPTENTALQLTPRRHLLSEFDSILHGNLFRNSHAETQQKQQIRRPTPAVPLPTLHGTIFVGGEAKAILKERNGQDIYGVGERVGGGTLTKIEEDRVVLDLGNRQAEVMLKSALKRIPSPPPIDLKESRVSKHRAGSVSNAGDQKKGSEEPVGSQPTISSLRMRRAQRLLERQQQMRRGQR